MATRGILSQIEYGYDDLGLDIYPTVGKLGQQKNIGYVPQIKGSVNFGETIDAELKQTRVIHAEKESRGEITQSRVPRAEKGVFLNYDKSMVGVGGYNRPQLLKLLKQKDYKEDVTGLTISQLRDLIKKIYE